MNWRVYQRILELSAVGAMVAGMVMMSNRTDPHHFVIYSGFVLLAFGKLIEAVNIHDPNFKILKVAACICILLLALLNMYYGVRSIVYIMIPLGIYYVLHYRLIFQQRKT